MLIAYFLLSIEVYLATYTIGTFHLSFWKISPTELRILLMTGNLVLLWQPMAQLFGYTWPLFDVGGVLGIAGMTLMLIWAIARHTAHLYRAEPLANGITSTDRQGSLATTAGGQSLRLK